MWSYPVDFCKRETPPLPKGCVARYQVAFVEKGVGDFHFTRPLAAAVELAKVRAVESQNSELDK